MAHLLIFGLGYTAKRIAAAMEARGWTVEATGSAGSVPFDHREAVLAALDRLVPEYQAERVTQSPQPLAAETL